MAVECVDEGEKAVGHCVEWSGKEGECEEGRGGESKGSMMMREERS